MGASVQARGIEAIAVRRTTVVDAEKVRYRVYSSPTEFVAVIAESALMALKVAGINEPYRIVRDLPTREVAIEAEKIAKQETVEKVRFSTEPRAPKAVFKAEIKPTTPSNSSDHFVPMQLRELNKKKGLDGFIVPHEVLHQLLEAVRKPVPPPAPKAEEAKAPPAAAAQPPTAAPAVESTLPPTPKEANDAAPPSAAAGGSEVLSEADVAKLLNE